MVPPIPQIMPQMQKVPFSHNLYDSYIEKATRIITEWWTEWRNDRVSGDDQKSSLIFWEEKFCRRIYSLMDGWVPKIFPTFQENVKGFSFFSSFLKLRSVCLIQVIACLQQQVVSTVKISLHSLCVGWRNIYICELPWFLQESLYEFIMKNIWLTIPVDSQLLKNYWANLLGMCHFLQNT